MFAIRPWPRHMPKSVADARAGALDATGSARLTVQQSSAASEVFPEGPGYKIFRSELPTGSPPLKPNDSADAWKRDMVSRRTFGPHPSPHPNPTNP